MAAGTAHKEFADVTVKKIVENKEMFTTTLQKILDTPDGERTPRARMILNAFHLYYEEIFAFGCSVSAD